MISLLVAMDRNQIIGSNNELPWHLPNDLQFFKKLTTGNTIIMGRKTFESIGKALPNRKNYVLTRHNKDEFPEDVYVLNDLETIINLNNQHPEEELFVIGGGAIFEQMMKHADRMYITYIDASFKGDTHFPIFTMDEWSLTSKIKGDKNEKNPYDFYFLQYDRR
ncbi:dihydrofolate reductase [Lentibacillus sp. N15]|uniref:dihydrofolate reductase n=1 Tax=Lentibacillus songyuanensis TaxID=3136161 RepID=UPI0031BA5C8F